MFLKRMHLFAGIVYQLKYVILCSLSYYRKELREELQECIYHIFQYFVIIIFKFLKYLNLIARTNAFLFILHYFQYLFINAKNIALLSS